MRPTRAKRAIALRTSGVRLFDAPTLARAAGCGAPDSDLRLRHGIQCPAEIPQDTDSSLPGSTVGRTDAMHDVYAAVKPVPPFSSPGETQGPIPRAPTVVPTTPIAVFA